MANAEVTLTTRELFSQFAGQLSGEQGGAFGFGLFVGIAIMSAVGWLYIKPYIESHIEKVAGDYKAQIEKIELNSRAREDLLILRQSLLETRVIELEQERYEMARNRRVDDV